MGSRIILILIIFFMAIAHAVDLEQLPPDIGKFEETDSAVTANAQEVVNRTRNMFAEVYSKAKTQYTDCISSPAPPSPLHKETSCILAGVLFNYSLNYATMMGRAEEFRRSILENPTNTDFSAEEAKISDIVAGIEQLMALGYFFNKDGTIKLPSPTVAREIKLSDFKTSFASTVLTATQVNEIKNILDTIDPSGPVTMAEVAPTEKYEVVDTTTTTVETIDPADRSIASLNVTYQGDPIGVSMANLFEMVSLVYGEISKDDLILTD